jgi:hypothetical protein
LKVVVTDACIFIDLYVIGLTEVFFLLEMEVHTTIDVLAELYAVQKQALQPFLEKGSLTAHNMEEVDRVAIATANYPKSLSVGDQTVLYIAEKINAIVLSSDKVVRNVAGARSLECHGLFWIFDELTASSTLSTVIASEKLLLLAEKNIIYRNNPKLSGELTARLKKWKGDQQE